MYINIYDYFDRWMANYIVYHTGHLEQYGDIQRAITHFDIKFQDTMSDIKDVAIEEQMKAIQVNTKNKSQKAAGGLKILSALEKDGLITDTLDLIAEGINENMELASQQVGFDNYEEILSQAGNFSGILARTDPDVNAVNSFFNLLVQAMAQAKLIDINILNALSNIGTNLVGTSFAIDTKLINQVTGFNTVDAQKSQKIIDSLAKAADKMNQEGIVSARSFSQTISYIFNKVIGNQLELLMAAEALNLGISQADSILDELCRRPLKNGKLTWESKGSQPKNPNIYFDSDIFNNGTFSLKVKKGKNQFYDIEIGTNIDTRWYKSGINSNTKVQALGNANISNYFSDGMEKYLAYNTIAHRFSGPTKSFIKESGDYRGMYRAFDNLVSSTAASYFKSWVKDKGFKTPTQKRAQFLVINGKVYSVMRIISNICDDIVKNGGYKISRNSNTAFKLNIPTNGVSNTWIGQNPNIELGIARSNIVNELINKITISANLNGNILLKYAYP